MQRRTADHRLVGRAGEVAVLRAALADAAAGDPGMVLVGGDAGVGKSRLVAEMAAVARAEGALVLIGQCVDIAGGLPYLPFADALRPTGDDPALDEALADALAAQPALSRLTPGPPSTLSDDSAGGRADLGQLQVFGAYLSVLGALSATRPVLLVIEDIHWADRSSRDLLSFLSRTLRHERLALVATYRADDLHRRHPLRPLIAELSRLPGVRRLDLAPLSASAMLDHLAEIAPGAPPEFWQRVTDRAEGNAFYAEELICCVGSRESLPEELADLLLARVEALDAGTVAVLHAAAVAGRRVDHRLLQRATDLDTPALEDALREALGQQVLVPSGGHEFVFRHALLQEAIYADLLPSERTRLHARYAAVLADEPGLGSAAELAYHCQASHDVPGALAASVRAADEAERAAAPMEALDHYERALSLYDRVPDAPARAGARRERLVLRAAAMAHAAGQFLRASALVRALLPAVDRAGEPLLAAEVAERLSQYALDAGTPEEVETAGRLALELTADQPPTPLRARVLAAWARALVGLDRHAEVPAAADEALVVARLAASPSDEADALGSLALAAEHGGDFNRAHQLLVQACRLAVDTGNLPVELRVRYHLARLHNEAGHMAEAAQLADDAIALAERSGLGWSPYGASLRFTQHLAYFLAGDWDHTQRLVGADMLRVSSPAGAALAVLAAHVEVARGDDRAAARLGQAAAYGHAEETVGYLAGVLSGDRAMWAGDVDAARTAFADTLERIRTEWAPLVLAVVRVAGLGVSAEADRAEQARLRGDAATVTDAVARGEELAALAEESVTTGGGEGRAVGAEARAWLAWARAELTRLRGADDPVAWQAAVKAFSYGDVYQTARSRWRLAEALVAAGRRDDAAMAWQAAHDRAERLGARPLLAALDDLARRARLATGPAAVPSTRRPADVELTTREVEVLRLVAAGLSNGKIGQRLYISTKTASVHVSNILAKLGATSRTEAASIAHQRGLLDDESAGDAQRPRSTGRTA